MGSAKGEDSRSQKPGMISRIRMTASSLTASFFPHSPRISHPINRVSPIGSSILAAHPSNGPKNRRPNRNPFSTTRFSPLRCAVRFDIHSRSRTRTRSSYFYFFSCFRFPSSSIIHHQSLSTIQSNPTQNIIQKPLTHFPNRLIPTSFSRIEPRFREHHFLPFPFPFLIPTHLNKYLNIPIIQDHTFIPQVSFDTTSLLPFLVSSLSR